MLKIQQARELWLDKVWLYLFGDSSGLTSPSQIRREGLDRALVRQAEIAAINATERELLGLRNGTMLRGHSGQVVDAIAVGDVPMYSFIEQPPADEERIASRFNKSSLLENVAHEIQTRELERSLIIRRLGLLAEEEILHASAIQSISSREPGAHWMMRWRQCAQDANAIALQRLWARILVREIANPGRYALSTLDTLAGIGESDIEGIELLARYVFGEFIFDSRGRYFQPQLHEVWLRRAEQIGLLQAVDVLRHVNLHSQAGDEQEPVLLINHRRALQLTGLSSTGIRLPVLRLTAIGKQILHLCGGDADMAYLLDLAMYLAEQGVHVALGDWNPIRRIFDKKIEYS